MKWKIDCVLMQVSKRILDKIWHTTLKWRAQIFTSPTYIEFLHLAVATVEDFFK